MEKRIAFMSTGCQCDFGRPREIIASIPELVEVNSKENPDYIMVNFCAISTENISAFLEMKQRILQLKAANPELKVLAGGCVEGLSDKKDLSFADAVYHHQEGAEAFLHFLGYDTMPELKPAMIYDAAYIVIAQGCNRRCTFCKVHYLDYMQLTSRPPEEIISLVKVAVSHGIHNIYLVAENSTEYGCDIGTNLCNLLQAIFAIDGVRYVDISGLCLDEVSPKLLKLLQDPKTRQLQLEVQSLYDPVRQAMGLTKTRDEALAILDALHDKALISNFMTSFIGSNVKEFNKELKLIRAHHLYFLTLSPYDDTDNTPSHRLYQPPTKSEILYYEEAFVAAVAAERKLLLEDLMAKDSIEATVAIVSERRYTLTSTHYSLKVYAKNRDNSFKVGDLVRVKLTGLYQMLPKDKQQKFIEYQELRSYAKGDSGNNVDFATFLHNLQYFGEYDQVMIAKGTIVST